MKAIRISLVLLVMLGLAAGVWFWTVYSRQHPATDDAYVAANTVMLSPQRSGQVVDVLVKSFQAVKKGEVLLRLDDSDARLAVQQAEVALALAQAQSQAAQAKTRATQAQGAASAEEQANAVLENQRNQGLASSGLIAREAADTTRLKLVEAQAALSAARATLDATQLAGTQAQQQIQAARLRLAQAQLDLARTVITAPADGILGEVNVQPGAFVLCTRQFF